MVMVPTGNAIFASALVLLTGAISVPALAARPGFMMRQTITAVRRQPLTVGNTHEHDVYPFAGAAFDNGFGMHWFVVGFYYVEHLSSDSQNGEGDYLARILDRDKKGKPRERWALGGECPALIASIKKMTTLEIPTLNVFPGPLGSLDVKNDLKEIFLDPPAYIVWGTGRTSGRPESEIDVEMAGASDAAGVGRWVMSTQKSMEACWVPNRPF